jgi:Sulfotransferase domain
MSLPTFLGIGVPRAGTTWLHSLLAGHPDVCLPTQRKEVRFFDRHYERGLAWYERFLCPLDDARRYKATGEISPQYFYCVECPRRIHRTLPTAKLLVMLRHPVDRAYSNFGFVVQRKNYRGSFEEFVATRPSALESGFYSRYLDRYLRYFDRRQILALVFEEAVTDRRRAAEALAAFLDLCADKFPSSLNRVNPSTVPRFESLSRADRSGRLRKGNWKPVLIMSETASSNTSSKICLPSKERKYLSRYRLLVPKNVGRLILTEGRASGKRWLVCQSFQASANTSLEGLCCCRIRGASVR